MIEAMTRRGTAVDRLNGRLGPAGYVVVLLWSLAMVMVVPARRLPWAALLVLAVALAVFPVSLKRILRPRWLAFLALLALPPLFLLGEVDTSLLGVGVSSEGLRAALQIAIRFLVVMVAVDGFASAVDVTAVAGMLEKLGLQGLGFSLGVAMNLLPALQESATNAWRSLWMRGGLRRRRWRGLQLLLVTVISNALRRAEEIALAAESRAFSPQHARPMPIRPGRWDLPATVVAPLILLAFSLL